MQPVENPRWWPQNFKYVYTIMIAKKFQELYLCFQDPAIVAKFHDQTRRNRMCMESLNFKYVYLDQHVYRVTARFPRGHYPQVPGPSTN